MKIKALKVGFSTNLAEFEKAAIVQEMSKHPIMYADFEGIHDADDEEDRMFEKPTVLIPFQSSLSLQEKLTDFDPRVLDMVETSEVLIDLQMSVTETITHELFNTYAR